MNKQQEAIVKMLLSDIMNVNMDKGFAIERYARFMEALQIEQILDRPVVHGTSLLSREDLT